MTGPLAGVRVLDFSAVVSGPLCGMWLADQGADVIKFESVTGDITRAAARTPELHGMSGLFTNCNRGKRSIAADLGTPEGKALLLEIAARSDVVLQNWRPGVVDRLGVGYDAVRAVNPDVVYVSISGFGEDGPYAQRRVYDPVIQGLTGHVSVQVNPEIPFPDLVRTIVCDKATAIISAQAITAALFARERGQGGQHLVVPMIDVGVSFFFPDGYMAKAWLDDPKADDRLTLAKSYRLNPTADGHLIYFCASEDEFEGLFRALGRHDWLDDDRFGTPHGRQANYVELGAEIAAAFETFATADIAARLLANDVPFAPALSLEEVPLDPQIVHNESLRIRDVPDLGRLLEARHPVRFSATPVGVTPVAPLLGQHSVEILRELGRDEAAIAALLSAGRVRG